MRKILMVTITVVGISALASGAFACGGMKTAGSGQGSGDSVASAPMSTASQQTQIAGSKQK